MDSVSIYGGIALQGQAGVQGSKNAVLPILAATLLTEGVNQIENCPRLADVYQMQTLLKALGCRVVREKETLNICTDGANPSATKEDMPKEAVKSMRSSIILLGALLNRAGEVSLQYPGGCVIGARPIDIHIKALEQLGVTFEEMPDGLRACTAGLKGACIKLPFPSVGATENLLLAAVGAEGTTILQGAAKEPEIQTLIDYLRACGAEIEGAGSEILKIHGQRRLRAVRFRIPGDRIVAGTYALACMAAGGEVFLKEAPCEQMGALCEVVRRMGGIWQEESDGLYVQCRKRPEAVAKLTTGPYPGFPTDLQSQMLSVLTLAKGECLITETVFENRFHVIPCLQRMGAVVEKLDERHAQVNGVASLHGARVETKELRGGAALVIAGLAAKGETIVDGCGYIERGYENICRDLRELGVRIYGVSEQSKQK